jgi:hypothetical protein
MDLSPGEPVPGSSSASPISELTSSDSETCNTSSARVYFGPLQSPEKKYISLHDVPNPPGTPVVRISLPQSPTLNLPNDNDSDAEDDNARYLRAGTPDIDPFPPDGKFCSLDYRSDCSEHKSRTFLGFSFSDYKGTRQPFSASKHA